MIRWELCAIFWEREAEAWKPEVTDAGENRSVMSLRVLTGNRVDGGTSPEMGNPGGEEVGRKLGCAGF